MSDNKKQTDNKHKCNQCSYKTDNSHDLYKHECQHHPKNKTEEVPQDDGHLSPIIFQESEGSEEQEVKPKVLKIEEGNEDE